MKYFQPGQQNRSRNSLTKPPNPSLSSKGGLQSDARAGNRIRHSFYAIWECTLGMQALVRIVLFVLLLGSLQINVRVRRAITDNPQSAIAAKDREYSAATNISYRPSSGFASRDCRLGISKLTHAFQTSHRVGSFGRSNPFG